MTKPTLSSYLREHLDDFGKKQQPGPYVTISRQYGCDGYEIGDVLRDKLNARVENDPDRHWRVYQKEMLRQLAEDTGLSEEILEREQMARPSLFKDILRGIRKRNIPDGFEIRSKITEMIRAIAFEGYAIIIGQGGAAATADLDNGLSVRLEASKDWRIARVGSREQLTRQAALVRIEKVEKQRRYLRKIYEQTHPREPGFNLLIDNSIFSPEQVVDIILFAMELRGLVPKK
ncbi:MAG: cytidylate kinase-like family protein [Sedimentisphaerales bacterium]|nr:cytidylate kinase-like family protein [Sedimentisphaerales bacterium]